MRTVGLITTGFLTAGLAGVVLMAVRSMPDIRRYLAMRRM
jgi:hypothetical protein